MCDSLYLIFYTLFLYSYYIDDSDDEPPDIPDINELDGFVRRWLPRNVLSCTNWLH